MTSIRQDNSVFFLLIYIGYRTIVEKNKKEVKTLTGLQLAINKG